MLKLFKGSLRHPFNTSIVVEFPENYMGHRVWVKFTQAFEKCSGGTWRGASATDDGVLRFGYTPFERYGSNPSLPQASAAVAMRC